MRSAILSIVILSVVTNGCKVVSYFNTSNDVLKKTGTVYYLNGTEETGEVTIMLETSHGSNNFILLSNSNGEKKILIDSIRSYKMNEDLFFPKIVDIDMNGSNKLLFVKRLTKENSRIHLFELHHQRSQSSDGNELFSYYISLPIQRRLDTWNIGGKHLIPDFDSKMSKMVEDCSTLYKKIRDKEKGYYISQFTIPHSKKAEVIKRIIEEYNACK